MANKALKIRYYLRIGGKIRGPFDVARLSSMRDRNRIGRRDEVSVDRLSWTMAGSISDIFPEGFEGLDSNPETSDWYARCDGVQKGPISQSTLQHMAQNGQLNTEDAVWRLGMPEWVLAGEVPELQFPKPQSWWQSLSGLKRAGLLVVASTLFIAPLGLIFAYYQHRAELAQIQVQQQVEHEKWLVERQLEQENQEADRSVQREVIAANARAEDQRNQLIQANQEALRRLTSIQNEATDATRDQTSGKFRIGERVRNNSYGLDWSGVITDIVGTSIHVRVDVSDGDSSVPRGMMMFQEYEIKKYTGSILDALFN